MLKLVFYRLFVVILWVGASFTPAHAVNPDEVLSDPVLEERARNLSLNLRCLVCQNQSIDDSDAGLAKDLRILLRQRLSSGDTDEEVIDYIVGRYGDFVLLEPKLNAQTIVLWALPIMMLLGGGVMAFLSFKRRPLPSNNDLSESEKKALTKLLDEGD